MRVAEEAVEVVDVEDMVEDAEAVDMVAVVAAMEVVDTEAAVMVVAADMEEADHPEVIYFFLFQLSSRPRSPPYSELTTQNFHSL